MLRIVFYLCYKIRARSLQDFCKTSEHLFRKLCVFFRQKVVLLREASFFAPLALKSCPPACLLLCLPGCLPASFLLRWLSACLPACLPAALPGWLASWLAGRLAAGRRGKARFGMDNSTPREAKRLAEQHTTLREAQRKSNYLLPFPAVVMLGLGKKHTPARNAKKNVASQHI